MSRGVVARGGVGGLGCGAIAGGQLCVVGCRATRSGRGFGAAVCRGLGWGCGALGKRRHQCRCFPLARAPRLRARQGLWEAWPLRQLC